MTETPYLTPGVEEASPGLMQHAAAILPIARYAPKNPWILLGAVALGIAGVVAWRNREKIAATAGPMLETAKVRSRELAHDAKVRGEELVEAAKDAGASVAARVRGDRARVLQAGPSGEFH